MELNFYTIKRFVICCIRFEIYIPLQKKKKADDRLEKNINNNNEIWQHIGKISLTEKQNKTRNTRKTNLNILCIHQQANEK